MPGSAVVRFTLGMNNILRRIIGAGACAGAGALLLLSASDSTLAGDERCLSDWGAAGSIVREHGLRTVEQLAEDKKDRGVGRIVQVKLCLAGVRYVYRLVVRDPSGSLKNMEVDAKPSAAPAK
ncbi:MAG: hypothetical protein R3D51_14575 [Hyphomicrobiaceae bacterium]